MPWQPKPRPILLTRSEEHTSELQSRQYLVCRLLLEKQKGHPKAALAAMRLALLMDWARRCCVSVGVTFDRGRRHHARRGWSCFFFKDTATTEIYTLSLHDALPISSRAGPPRGSIQPQRQAPCGGPRAGGDRKSTRLNSSHANISYAVFCLKKK